MKSFIIIIIKICKRLKSYLKKIGWKILFPNAFKCGQHTCFYPKTHIVIEKDGKIEIGSNCFFNRNCSINSMGKISIGDNCIFGENVCIYDHNHKYRDNSELIRKQKFNIKGIKIGNNCWIGSNVTILAGVEIGDNVVVGANTLVCKSISTNSVAVNDNKLIIKEK